MIISDINYLEVASEEIFGGRGTNINNVYSTVKTVTANVNESYNKNFNVNTGGVKGSTAEAVFSADATGNNTFSSVIGGVQTEPGRSETFINAVAVSA